MTVYFENEVDAVYDFNPEEICKQCIETVLDHLHCPYECEVSISVTDSENIQKINRQFRQVDAPTDVLSFPMMEYDVAGDFESESFVQSLSIQPETGEAILGDIVLCDTIIRKQAEEYGHSQLREFSFLVVHSLLHLCGFDHMEDEERFQMEEKQREIMKQLNINR